MMFVILRTDKEYGAFTILHKTLEEATIEAERLARHHAKDNPEFNIYELKIVKTLYAQIDIKVWVVPPKL